MTEDGSRSGDEAMENRDRAMTEETMADEMKLDETFVNEAKAAEEKAQPRRTMQVDRVVDVPLAVTIRFGQRQLMLRELLELGAGSLLELDRQVEEPVDLMLGERVIARGEVVIVDGNYGMRVTEVLEVPVRGAGRQAQTVGYANV